MSFGNNKLFISKSIKIGSLIIGKISNNEKIVKFDIEIHCSNCHKQVPGGLKTGETYYQTKEFKIEIKDFMKNYLCGMCRDKKRLGKN